MKVTDTLQDNTLEISDKEMNYFVHFVMSSLLISEKSHQKQQKMIHYKNYIKSLQDGRNIASTLTSVSDHTITIIQRSHIKTGFFSRVNKS